MNFLFSRRKWMNRIALALASVAMLLGIAFLAAILWTLLKNGLPLLRATTFTQITPPPGESGGLRNALEGTVILTVVTALIGTPIGILAGTFLAEYGQDSKLASVVRFVNGVLLSAPSVVIGFFAYIMIVATTGHFSGWAGVASLTIILVPVVVSSTENMLRLVPSNLREAAAALGAPQWKTIVSVIYSSAKTGIFTGVLLGVARISGESAPLLFTALNNQFININLSKAMPNIPVTIFQFAMSPYEEWQKLAWTGALIITMGVLFLNVFVRLILRPGRKSR